MAGSFFPIPAPSFRSSIRSLPAITSVKGIVFAAAATFLMYWIFWNRGHSNSTSSGIQPVFSLLVSLKFQDIASKTQFLQDIAPLVKYIRQKEPDTVAYEVLFSDKDPLQVMMLERYKDKDHAYMKVHKSSKHFLEFRAKLEAMKEADKVAIMGESYMDSMVGFLDRNN